MGVFASIFHPVVRFWHLFFSIVLKFQRQFNMPDDKKHFKQIKKKSLTFRIFSSAASAFYNICR